MDGDRTPQSMVEVDEVYVCCGHTGWHPSDPKQLRASRRRWDRRRRGQSHIDKDRLVIVVQPQQGGRVKVEAAGGTTEKRSGGCSPFTSSKERGSTPTVPYASW
jgi:hypothetical protein